MQRFLFLDLLDSEVHAVLAGLRKEFGTLGSGIHVTIRGPYNDPIEIEQLGRFQREISKEPLLIHGVGIFENRGSCSVFLRVKNDKLRGIWRKPDFPVKEYGFNPHITLYEGSDLELAHRILDFLKKEDLRLLCHDVRLREYVSKQTDMFGQQDMPQEEHFLGLSNRSLVRADILQRAEHLVRKHRRQIGAENRAAR